jgi:DNA gyrase subunit A
MVLVEEEGSILTATENGFGKCTPVSDYPLKGRGGQGVISIQTKERNGKVVGAVQVKQDNEIMMITDSGTLVRIAVDDVSEMGRNTQGVRLIRLTRGEKLVEVEKIEVFSPAESTDSESMDSGSTDSGSTDSGSTTAEKDGE